MNKSGPVIVIEDDEDDQQFLRDVFVKLDYKNEVVFFADGEQALAYLDKGHVQPFLILSDINMPKLSGYQLREKIKTDSRLEVKCIPYLFFTTSANRQNVIDAYSLNVQGFFTKPVGLDKLEGLVKIIMEYWSLCAAPNTMGN